jgi:hypothetical protein
LVQNRLAFENDLARNKACVDMKLEA